MYLFLSLLKQLILLSMTIIARLHAQKRNKNWRNHILRNSINI